MALTDNLVAYYKLDGNSNDAVSSNNGTDSNITYDSAYGKINQGALFNGGSSFIDTHITSNPGTGDFGISLWAKTTSTSNPLIMIQKYNGSGDNWWLGVSGGTTNVAHFSVNGTDLTGTTKINDGNYHHIVAYRTSGVLYLYVDNVSQGSVAYSGSCNPGGNIIIGRFGTGYYWWSGDLDEIVYRTAGFTSTEVSQLWNGGDGLQYPFTTANTSNFFNFF